MFWQRISISCNIITDAWHQGRIRQLLFSLSSITHQIIYYIQMTFFRGMLSAPYLSWGDRGVFGTSLSYFPKHACMWPQRLLGDDWETNDLYRMHTLRRLLSRSRSVESTRGLIAQNALRNSTDYTGWGQGHVLVYLDFSDINPKVWATWFLAPA